MSDERAKAMKAAARPVGACLVTSVSGRDNGNVPAWTAAELGTTPPDDTSLIAVPCDTSNSADPIET